MEEKEKKDLNEAILFGIPVFSSEKEVLLEKIENEVLEGKFEGLFWINTPNAEQIVQASNDDVFRCALNKSTVRVPDGVSLVWSSKVLKALGISGESIKERVSGVDLVWDICKVGSKKRSRVFLLGGKGQVAEFAGQKLAETYPGIRVVGASAGFENVRKPSESENEEILRQIHEEEVEVLLVGYGAPWQEMWVESNRKALEEIGVKLVMVVGGTYDMISGNVLRAPGWMRRAGFEWLWRLLQQPWRWKRQLRLVKYWWMVGKLLVNKKNA